MISHLRFLAVLMTLYKATKSRAPSSVRKQPKIFMQSFIILKSRSAKLLVKGMFQSLTNRRKSFFYPGAVTLDYGRGVVSSCRAYEQIRMDFPHDRLSPAPTIHHICDRFFARSPPKRRANLDCRLERRGINLCKSNVIIDQEFINPKNEKYLFFFATFFVLRMVTAYVWDAFF